MAWFPVQLACSSPGFYSHHQSGLTDWEQTSGSPWTHSVPFPSQNKHQVIVRGKRKRKKIFSWLRSQFGVKPNSDSRRGCYVAVAVLKGGAMNSGLQARHFSLSESLRKSRRWTPLWPQILSVSWNQKLQHLREPSISLLTTSDLAQSLIFMGKVREVPEVS